MPNRVESKFTGQREKLKRTRAFMLSVAVTSDPFLLRMAVSSPFAGLLAAGSAEAEPGNIFSIEFIRRSVTLAQARSYAVPWGQHEHIPTSSNGRKLCNCNGRVHVGSGTGDHAIGKTGGNAGGG